MDKVSVSYQVKKLLSKSLGIPVESITDDAGPNTVQRWDSLAHLNIMLSIEEQFKIKLSLDDFITAVSVEGIVDLVTRNINKSD
jgi:acyl carrier protein